MLVVGAARSGIAATEFLLGRGARVTLTDLLSEDALAAAVAPLMVKAQYSGELVLELGGHNRESFRRCDLVVVSPGVPLTLPLFDESRKAGIPVIAEVELAFRHLKGRILGITGSNGKTTTTALLAELLRGAGLRGHAAGNIGVPLISFTARSTAEDIYATELSSFQLEGILDFRPRIAAVLNLTPDHLDRYSDFDSYTAAKKRIFMNQTRSDFAVLNADDPLTAQLADQVHSKPLLFSRRSALKRGAYLNGGNLIYREGTKEHVLCSTQEIKLKGQHNLENVLAACTIALLSGAMPEKLREVVKNFPGVEHRLEWVAEIDGVQYYNDSKATNVDAARKSLEAFPGNIHWIAGGRDKGGDFRTLRSLIGQRVKRIILLGEAASKIREALGGQADISDALSLPEAVRHCKSRARPGDVVLLAPACASFDMFIDYEHRGRVFKDAVRKLATER